MKRYMAAAVICGCLLIGSLYPKLLLEHHVKLVDAKGNEISVEGEYSDEIPVKLEFRLLNIFR
ncbi:MAG: hypothetical protein U0M69_03990 [Lachnospiraceae bacterium]|nr:hypothetical protein [Lachnospiraceae bacterium]